MKRIKFDWDKVNWIDQDVVIARTLGCTREAVRQKRKLVGAKRSPYFHKINHSVLNKLVKMETEGMALEDIAAQLKCRKVYAKKVLKEYNKPFIFIDGRKGGKYEWAKADWTKTDKQVAQDLGVSNSGTVTQHRRRLGIIKSRVKIVKFGKEKTSFAVRKFGKVKNKVNV